MRATVFAMTRSTFIALSTVVVAMAYAGVIFLGMWITHTPPY